MNVLLKISIGNEGIYSMGEGKKKSHLMFREYLTRRPYPRNTREILQAGMTLQLPTCASHVALLWVSFSRASREIHLLFNSCSILHQLNTKPNTIKSHKIPGTKLKQLQHFLSWNKANIKHNCKSQPYTNYQNTKINQTKKIYIYKK